MEEVWIGAYSWVRVAGGGSGKDLSWEYVENSVLSMKW